MVYLLLENGEIMVADGESGGIGFAVLGAVAAVGVAAAGVKIYRSSKASAVVGADRRDQIGQLPDEEQAQYAELQNVAPDNIRAPLRGN